MIDITPDPIAIQLGPLPVYWYGICYAIGLLVAYQIMMSEARRRGLDSELIINGLIIVAIAALIGGRLYHVIDQWSLYKDDLLKIVLPPYSGLGVYGGLVTGTIAFVLLVRRWHLDLWTWADIVAPALFACRPSAGSATSSTRSSTGRRRIALGIAIQCKNRVAQYACPAGLTPTRRWPAFPATVLYEAVSAVIGLLFCLLGRRPPTTRAGDLLLIFFIWYG
jgi:phosphatidylglycerol:prolipoprotein diacylglycerol transferase